MRVSKLKQGRSTTPKYLYDLLPSTPMLGNRERPIVMIGWPEIGGGSIVEDPLHSAANSFDGHSEMWPTSCTDRDLPLATFNDMPCPSASLASALEDMVQGVRGATIHSISMGACAYLFGHWFVCLGFQFSPTHRIAALASRRLLGTQGHPISLFFGRFDEAQPTNDPVAPIGWASIYLAKRNAWSLGSLRLGKLY